MNTKNLLSCVCFFLFYTSINAQVVQQQADKIQLVKRLEIESKVSSDQLIKLKPSTVKTFANSKKAIKIHKKQKRNQRNKILKHRKDKNYLRNDKK